MPLSRCVSRCFVAFFVCAGVALSLSCDGSTGFECQCFPCTSAIALTVVDEAGAPVIGDWVVEAALDGFPVETSNCDPATRANSNTCGFGSATGVYEVVVRTPREEKELKARFAGRAGQDCCNCLTGEVVQVVLQEG